MGGAGSLLRLGAAVLVRISDCDYLCLGKYRPDVPDAVAIVAPAGVADDSDSVANLSSERNHECAREKVPCAAWPDYINQRRRGLAKNQPGT